MRTKYSLPQLHLNRIENQVPPQRIEYSNPNSVSKTESEFISKSIKEAKMGVDQTLSRIVKKYGMLDLRRKIEN